MVLVTSSVCQLPGPVRSRYHRIRTDLTARDGLAVHVLAGAVPHGHIAAIEVESPGTGGVLAQRRGGVWAVRSSASCRSLTMQYTCRYTGITCRS
jgi:hypothetical protein